MSSVLFPRALARSCGPVVGAALLCALSVADAQRTAPPRPTNPAPRRAPVRRPAPPSLGIFQGTTDVGRASALGPGVARYDPRTRSYVVTGGGADMWGTADHFRYIWVELSGDVALEATVRFTGSAPDSGQPNAHRVSSSGSRSTRARRTPMRRPTATGSPRSSGARRLVR